MCNYSLRFNSLGRYDPLMVQTMEDKSCRFVLVLGFHVAHEYLEVSTHVDMDISQMQAFSQRAEDLFHQLRDTRTE